MHLQAVHAVRLLARDEEYLHTYTSDIVHTYDLHYKTTIIIYIQCICIC